MQNEPELALFASFSPHQQLPFTLSLPFHPYHARPFHPFTVFIVQMINAVLCLAPNPLHYSTHIANDFIYVYYVFESAIIIYLS